MSRISDEQYEKYLQALREAAENHGAHKPGTCLHVYFGDGATEMDEIAAAIAATAP